MGIQIVNTGDSTGVLVDGGYIFDTKPGEDHAGLYHRLHKVILDELNRYVDNVNSEKHKQFTKQKSSRTVIQVSEAEAKEEAHA